MSEYNWLQALDMVRFNYGEAVMGGLKLTVMQGYRGIYWIIYETHIQNTGILHHIMSCLV